MSCDSKAVLLVDCETYGKLIAVGYLRKGDRVAIENASRSGKQSLLNELKEILSRPENNPKQKVFDDTCESAKKIIEQYQWEDLPDYNQTKYIKQKANAKPFFNGKNSKLARNNIKQKFRP